MCPAPGELFPRLQQACGNDRLREFGDKVRTLKKIAPTHPHPHSPGTTLAGPVAGLVDRVRDTLSKSS